MTSRSDLRNAAGFSLLELMVALTILALAMSVVSVSATRRSPSFEMQRLAGNVVSLLREARLDAQTSGRPARVSFDADTRELSRNGSEGVSIPEGVDASLVSSASAGSPAIIFFPDGSSTGGEFALEGSGRRERVTVDWLTSRIERLDPA
jgi:general secretion pathway protein H